MERIETAGIEFCAIEAPEALCFYSKKQQFLKMFPLNSFERNITNKYNTDEFPKYPWSTAFNVIRIIWTVLPVVPLLAITRIITAVIGPKIELNYVFTYIFELELIALPIIFFVSVYNDYVGHLLPALILSAWLHYFFILKKPQNFYYNWGGRRPYVLTLNRATINLLTAYCILAVDFPSFPQYFVKTHEFGASLMDIGIGLFVYSMGAVSEPLRKIPQFIKVIYSVAILFGLGIVRTLIIEYTSYTQDAREYGIHWNAFFTLAISKLTAMILSYFSMNNNIVLFAMGVAYVIYHESILQMGTSDFVMNKAIMRNTFMKANREGILSLPGFTAIYLLSMVMGQYLRIHNDLITKKVFLHKLKYVCISAIVLWMSVFSCIFLSISIARVTCNLGYILLVLAIAQTMTAYYMMGFHTILSQPDEVLSSNQLYLPLIVEAVNKNGLVFFLVSNLLTGVIKVNLYKLDLLLESSIVILNAYMFLAISVVQILHYYNKSIG